jgi:hypothetical protein
MRDHRPSETPVTNDLRSTGTKPIWTQKQMLRLSRACEVLLITLVQT